MGNTRLLYRALLVVLGIALFPTLAVGEWIPTFSLRALAIKADVIVIAEAIDPLRRGNAVDDWKEPIRVARFRVLRVLRGPRELNTIRVGEIYLYHLYSRLPDPDEPSAEAPEIKQSLLFLETPEHPKPNVDYIPVCSGVRHVAVDGTVLDTYQVEDNGLSFRKIPEVTWSQLKDKVRAEIAKVDRLFALKEIAEPRRRNQKLFEWLEEEELLTRKERPVKRRHDSAPGWGGYERKVLGWIVGGPIADDAWRAAQIARKLNPHRGHYVSGRAFQTADGRLFLWRIFSDMNSPIDDRRLALGCFDGYRLAEPAHETWIERISPLLAGPDEELQLLAAERLYGLAQRGEVPQLALPALVEAYRGAAAGDVRNAIAHSIYRLSHEEQWQELTGNPKRILVLLSAFSIDPRSGDVQFLMSRQRTLPVMRRVPDLIAERLDPKGRVVEVRKLSLPVTTPPHSTTWRWDGGGVTVRVPAETLAPGYWKLRVEGVAGKKGEHSWRSEPYVFEVKRATDEPK